MKEVFPNVELDKPKVKFALERKEVVPDVTISFTVQGMERHQMWALTRYILQGHRFTVTLESPQQEMEIIAQGTVHTTLSKADIQDFREDLKQEELVSRPAA